MDATKTRCNHARLEYLELLRFILAFLTMAWHYYYFGPLYGEISAPAIHFPGFRYLSFTVEAFFIISGFVIIASAANRKPLDFLVGRVVRLGPCLLVCASITVIAGLLAGEGLPFGQYLKSILILPLALGDGVDWSYWSLRFEILFYTFVFFCLCLGNIRKHIFSLAALVIAYDVFVALLPRFGLNPTLQLVLRFPLERYGPFFAIGMLLYLVFQRKEFDLKIGTALVMASAMGCVRSWQEDDRIADLLFQSPGDPLTACCIFAIVLATFVAFVRSTRNERIARLFSVLGKTSYPLYLVHQQVGYVVINFLEKQFATSIDVRPAVMLVMVLLAAAVAIGLEPPLAACYKRGLFRLIAAIRSIRVRAPTPESELGSQE